MAGVLTILLMSASLGVASFGIGQLPLFFTFSRARIAYLSTLGTGLLLGAALGIIIPEGIETLLSSQNSKEPSQTIALALLSGFAFMLLVEQLSSGHAHPHGSSYKQPYSPLPGHAQLDGGRTSRGAAGSHDALRPEVEEEEFDLGLESGERGEEETHHLNERRNSQTKAVERARAFPLTLGLVIHSLADGLALGASALTTTGGGREDEGGDSSRPNVRLSVVVFFALIVHKAPTALALSTSLLSKSLSVSECRKHLALFSLATPLGALGSFGLLSMIGAGVHEDWTGTALLVSGGTFLYVATVLQPLSHQDSTMPPSSEMNDKIRASLIVAGMFIPFLISLIIGHGH